MASLTQSIMRRAKRRPGDRLNILTAPTHESFESNLCRTNHNFYALRVEGPIKNWETKYRPLPPNYTLLNKDLGDYQLLQDLDFDLVLSQHKFGQFQILGNVARQIHAPLISLEHTEPMPQWQPAYLHQFRQMNGYVNVFITEYNRERWGYTPENAVVIHHAIDTELFKPQPTVEKKLHALSVCNDWKNRDWCCGFTLWQQLTQGIPVKVLGDNPGLSKPAESPESLAQAYGEAAIFLNTSLASPIPMSVLEGMAAGCCVISTATSQIPKFITHGYDGLISNNPHELRAFLEQALQDESLRRRLGENARRKICEKYSLDQFVRRWNDVFEKAAAMVVRP